ncbi:glycosyltransferase [Micromonosporaceae bacterium B7E4]
MTHVLMIAVAPPAEQTILVDALKRFRGKGATVHLACFFETGTLEIEPGLAELHTFAVDTAADPRFRRTLARSQPARRPWLHARRSHWIREHARRADLMVAVDAKAINTVWELAQRNTRADAISGLAPALRALTARVEAAGATANGGLGRQVRSSTSIGVRGVRRFVVDTGRSTLLNASGTKVMKLPAGAWLWSKAVAAPRIPDNLRSKLALRVHTSMVRAGQASIAIRTSAAAASRIRDAQTRARLLADEALAELDLGRVPTELRSAVTAQLSNADAWATKNPKRAVDALASAFGLLTHRVLHLDQVRSPLLIEPDAFLAPVRTSTAARRLSAPRGRSTIAAPPPTDRPQRLLLVVPDVDESVEELRRHCAELSNVELRLLGVDAAPDSRAMARDSKSIMEEILTRTSPFGVRVEDWIRPHLDWADTVLVDRCLSTAALVTLHDPGATRIIVRLNGPELFELWPHLVDFSRVDTLVLPSVHLREPAQAVLPWLAEAEAPRIEVLGDPLHLRPYDRPKSDDARFTLGLVGFNAVTRDPRWAIEVLRILRKQDQRYRLMLVGTGLSAKTSAAAKRYNDQLRKDYAELEPAGALLRQGPTDDLPQTLTGIGVILDSSVYQGFPRSLVLGAASGAVPVARDWPAFAGRSEGAAALLPAEWVAATPQQAAERVLAVTATEERWREAGREAAGHTYATWDWPVVRPEYDRLLGRTGH